MNRSYFIARIKRAVFGGKIGQSQIDGVNFLLDVRDLRFPQVSKYELAYILATAFHETGAKMRPVKEAGGNAYYTRLYDIKGSRPNLARKRGNTQPGDGARYCGRGYPQTTWKCNYANVGPIVAAIYGEHIDFTKYPDKLLDPKYSSVTMYYSMIHGSYTGRKLSDYISDTRQDYVGARAIINGDDRAKLIAGYATAFLDALTQAEAQPNDVAPVTFVAAPADGKDIEPLTDDAPESAPADAPVLDAGATGKSLAASKTTWATAASGVVGATAVAKQTVDQAQGVIDAANAAKDTASSAWTLASGLGPWLFALVVIAVAAGVVIYERRRHSLEFGV